MKNFKEIKQVLLDCAFKTVEDIKITKLFLDYAGFKYKDEFFSMNVPHAQMRRSEIDYVDFIAHVIDFKEQGGSKESCENLMKDMRRTADKEADAVLFGVLYREDRLKTHPNTAYKIALLEASRYQLGVPSDYLSRDRGVENPSGSAPKKDRLENTLKSIETFLRALMLVEVDDEEDEEKEEVNKTKPSSTIHIGGVGIFANKGLHCGLLYKSNRGTDFIVTQTDGNTKVEKLKPSASRTPAYTIDTAMPISKPTEDGLYIALPVGGAFTAESLEHNGVIFNAERNLTTSVSDNSWKHGGPLNLQYVFLDEIREGLIEFYKVNVTF